MSQSLSWPSRISVAAPGEPGGSWASDASSVRSDEETAKSSPVLGSRIVDWAMPGRGAAGSDGAAPGSGAAVGGAGAGSASSEAGGGLSGGGSKPKSSESPAASGSAGAANAVSTVVSDGSGFVSAPGSIARSAA